MDEKRLKKIDRIADIVFATLFGGILLMALTIHLLVALAA